MVQMMMYDAISGADHHAISGASLRASIQEPIKWRRLIFVILIGDPCKRE